ncbi:MAG: zinc ribbon domain-containing protein [Verrucomicrobiota bacterium]|nr:zinc ribbon domain-containing protein [Verrucomicrobiota bacterium]
MPTYDYSCAQCGKTIEVFQSIKAPHLKTCPEDACAKKKWGKGKVKRLLGTGGGIIFKGGGFYETDYRSESYKSGEKRAADAVKKATEKKSDSKKKSSDTKKTKPSKPKKT